MKTFNKEQKRKILHYLIDDGGMDWLDNDKNFWEFVCSNFNLYEDFIREYRDNIDWPTLCKNKITNDINFMREFKDKLDWFLLSINSNLTKEQKKEFWNKLYKYEVEDGNSN